MPQQQTTLPALASSVASATKVHMLKEMISELKQKLNSANLPFGIGLLTPQIGGSAQETNAD
jgi:hypothetical protein